MSYANVFLSTSIKPTQYSSSSSRLIWSIPIPDPDIVFYKHLSNPHIKASNYWLRILLGNDYRGKARFHIVMNGIDVGQTKYWNEDTPFVVYSEMYCIIPESALFFSNYNTARIRQPITDPSLRIRVIGSSLPSFVRPGGGIYDGFSSHDKFPSPATGQYVDATPVIFLESIPEVYHK